MMKWWPFTPKQSDAALLISTITKLTAELAAQSEASRKFSETILEFAKEKDAQIKLVLEAKFQPYVAMLPTRTDKPAEPDNIEHLQDVTEVSEEAATEQMIKNTTAERTASAALEAALEEEFKDIAREHAEAHGKVQP